MRLWAHHPSLSTSEGGTPRGVPAEAGCRSEISFQTPWCVGVTHNRLTLLHRPSMHAFGAQNCSNTAALLLILALDQRDLQQGNYRYTDECLHELDLELSDEPARTLTKGDA